MGAHSRWNGDKLAHGEHKGYRPGEDGNPKRRGKVRGGYQHPDAVSGPGGLLATLTPFTGHSMRAFKRYTGDGGWVYTVYSYDQPIAQWRHTGVPNHTPKVWIDTSRYSHITSVHQGAAHAWIGHAVDKYIAPSIVS